jgi:hypothetical protein
MYPTAYMGRSVGAVETNYTDPTGGFEYYNVENIYNYTSYWDEEIYRFGVVYILNNYTLSPVFNVRGKSNVGLDANDSTKLENYYTDPHAPLYDTNGNRIFIQTENNLIKGGKTLENDKGVVRFKTGKSVITGQTVTPIGVKFWIDKEVISEIKKYCKGIMFVRQKRIPTILAQALTIGLDKNCFVPMLPVDTNKYMAERFIDDSKMLTHNFE